ncbi:MAG: hypothetical protein AAFQ79_07155 [Pseudomonadota bacterium]
MIWRMIFVAAFPGVALAQWVDITEAPVQREIALTCTFTTECMDTEGCADTSYTVTLDGLAGGLAEDQMVVGAIMVSDAASVEMSGTLIDDILRLNSFDTAMPQLLISTADGARLTAHITSVPLAITYAGTCE